MKPREWLHEPSGTLFVLVSGGTFEMGVSRAEIDAMAKLDFCEVSSWPAMGYPWQSDEIVSCVVSSGYRIGKSKERSGVRFAVDFKT